MSQPHTDANGDGDGERDSNSPRNAYADAHPRTNWQIQSDTKTTPNRSASPHAVTLFAIQRREMATSPREFQAALVSSECPRPFWTSEYDIPGH